MKTSNKLIISLIAAPFVIMSFVDVALYNKFKNGDFVLQSSIDEMKREKVFLGENIHTVELTNLYSVEIILSDSNYIEWDKNEARDIEQSIRNGQLTIGLKKQIVDRSVNSYENVKLHLKNTKEIILTKCISKLLIDKNAKQDSLLTITANLEAQIEIGENANARNDSMMIVASSTQKNSFHNLYIISRADVFIADDARIQNLKIELQNDGKLNADKCNIDKLDLQMSGNSRLDVSGQFYERYFNKNGIKPVASTIPVPTK
jgi:hypothetical protein